MDIISQHFDSLKSIRLKIKHCFHEIDSIKLQVKQYYDTYIQQEPSDYFGLDSFHFQNKSMELEYKHLLELYHFIDNRIYGDYYKLFVMMEFSLKKQLTNTQYDKMNELTHIHKYPIYKDLEPYVQYDFDLINQLHQDIILTLSNVKSLAEETNMTIEENEKDIELGMNIENYIINQKYINNTLINSNELHKSYLNIYHKYHTEWLNKFYSKIQLFYTQIKHHIVDTSNNDSTISIYIKEYVNEIIDKVEDTLTGSTPTFTPPS